MLVERVRVDLDRRRAAVREDDVLPVDLDDDGDDGLWSAGLERRRVRREMHARLRDVVDDDLGVPERSLGGRARASLVVAAAGDGVSARNVHESNLEVVKLRRVRQGRLEAEDVDDLLGPHGALEVVREVVRVLEDRAAGGARDQVQRFIRLALRTIPRDLEQSVLRLVLQSLSRIELAPNAADIDGIEDDVRAFRDVGQSLDELLARRRAVPVVVVQAPNRGGFERRRFPPLLVLVRSRIASEDQARIEPFGEEKDVFLTAHAAQHRGQAGEERHLAVDFFAVVRVFEAVDCLNLVFILRIGPFPRLIHRRGNVPVDRCRRELQRIERGKGRGVVDRRCHDRPVGGERRQQPEPVCHVDGRDRDPVVGLHHLRGELPRRLLRAADRRRRRERQVEKHEEVAPRRGGDRR